MKIWYFFIQIFLKILLIPLVKLFFKIEVVGRGNAKRIGGPLIITPNHKSYIDHFLIGAALPLNLRLYPVRPMAHKEQMDRRIVGLGIKFFGGFVAKTIGKNLDELFSVPIGILKEGGTILLYPEGRMNTKKDILPAMSGAAELGLRASAKYLPVGISGLDNFSLNELLSCPFVRRKIRISFGSFYSAEGFHNRKELTKKIESEIRVLYDPDYHEHLKHPS